MTKTPLRPVASQSKPRRAYYLSDVTLEIPAPDTAIFRAKLNGPAEAMVWARAWLASERDGTVAEAASEGLKAADVVTLTVKMRDQRLAENGFIRIESAPLVTEDVVVIRLPGDSCAASAV
jgi:hypothetical protein